MQGMILRDGGVCPKCGKNIRLTFFNGEIRPDCLSCCFFIEKNYNPYQLYLFDIFPFAE